MKKRKEFNMKAKRVVDKEQLELAKKNSKATAPSAKTPQARAKATQ
jgi:hypothetical protein